MKGRNTTILCYPLILLLLLSLLQCKIVDEIFIDDPVIDDPDVTVSDTLWIHESPVKDSMYLKSTLAIGINGDIYYVAAGASFRWVPARVFAINKADGTLRWMSGELDHSTGVSSQIVVGDDGTVYVIGYYTLYAIDPGSGAFKWTWQVPDELPHPDNPNGKVYTKGQIGALALTDDGNLMLGSVGAGVYSRALYGIDKSGNRMYYNLQAVGDGVISGIFIGKNNTAFYYSTVNGKPSMMAVNTNTGAIKWSLEIASSLNANNIIAIKDNGDLFCSFRKVGENIATNHIVQADDGVILWSGTAATNGNLKWIGPDGQYYEFDNGIHSVNATNGEKTKIVSGEFGAITENNRLVTAFTDADFIRKLGVFLPDGYLDYNIRMHGLSGYAIAIADDYSIYAIVNTHSTSFLPTEICAFKGESPLARSGWPRAYHDNRNTSNINKR